MSIQIQRSGESNVVYLPRQDRPEPQVLPMPRATSADRTRSVAAHLQFICEHRGAAALLIVRIREHQEFVESFGDAWGERLDVQISRRLKNCLRTDDPVVPLGKGEYAVVIPEPENRQELDQLCERLMQAGSGTYQLDEVSLRTSTAIGVALYPTDSNQFQEVMRFANVALRRADAEHGGGYSYFSQELLKRQRYKLWMDGELKRALADERFTLHYQPQYALDGHVIVGMEALVRMVTTEGELIQPNDFISIAEENGLIVDIGYWVISEACRQLAAWRGSGNGPRRMAVNVSPRQLQDRNLPGVIRKAVERSGLQTSDLELEVTESCMLKHLPVTGDVLHELRALGVRIAIDDFGAGYSCFANLARLPLDSFKLDRSFLTDISGDPRARQVVTAMIAMARELGYEIIAEGVETDQQYWFLQASGCHLVQGFGLAKPQEAGALTELLENSVETAGQLENVAR